MYRLLAIAIPASLLLGPALPASAESDVARGAPLFAQCKICHSLEAGKNQVGPSLHGLFGRRSASVPDYEYSSALKRANLVWNDDTLAKYLADPKKAIPGNKMAFPGIKDPNQLGDLLAFLKQATR